jgi:hypothetical protein
VVWSSRLAWSLLALFIIVGSAGTWSLSARHLGANTD